MSDKTVYRSKIDWWLIVTVVLFPIVIVIVAGIGTSWWITALLGAGIAAMTGVMIGSCWYAIEGDTLLVYQFFRPTRLPIAKIKEVKYCTGILAGPCLSVTRLSIKFTDRSVLRSSMPIEISPKDRDGFVARLLRINPRIKVIKP